MSSPISMAFWKRFFNGSMRTRNDLIANSEHRGNGVKPNPTLSAWVNLRQMDTPINALEKRLLFEIKALYGKRLVSVVVFGSAGRGTQRCDSDLDVLVVADRLPRGRMKRVEEFSSVENRIEPFLKSLQKTGIATDLSPVFKSPEEAERGSPLFLDMVEDARILVDRNRFFEAVLKRLRGRLEKLGARRIWMGNAWYWDLKPDYKPGECFEL